MGRKDIMEKDIAWGIYWINDFNMHEHIKAEWKSKLEILNDKFDRTPDEKKIFIDNIVENTLSACLGENWQSLTGNNSIFTVDFSNS
jgi:hypothetical protein